MREENWHKVVVSIKDFHSLNISDYIIFTIPFANIGRCKSRTFPRIGDTLESTPFRRGVNCKASKEI